MTDTFTVITTIFKPSEPVQRFAEICNGKLIVVGDKKTPEEWALKGAIFLSAPAQQQSSYALAGFLPWNHYARKNLGYLHAMKMGADVIADTDDDNLPKAGWSSPGFTGTFSMTPQDRGFINIYKSFSKKHIWPRGFPLDRILDERSIVSDEQLTAKNIEVGVWQGLVDEDPDVDAIYRLVDGTVTIFDAREPIVLAKGSVCPFNSQNTVFRKELFPLLYLPVSVSFRFTDILRSIIAQPIMWTKGYHLGFTSATAVQKRNPHNYLKDFESEIPCFLHTGKAFEEILKNTRPQYSLTDNLRAAYEALYKVNIVQEQELDGVSAWINDIGNIYKAN